MQKTTTILPEMVLVGITCRTNNKAEMNPATAKIGVTLQHYFGNALAEKIPGRSQTQVTYCVYSDYESDVTGDYTYFVGEAVAAVDKLPQGFTRIIIPSQRYIKFTDGPAAMPQVCIAMWQKIWQMPPQTLGGERAYLADFEVYDARARDPQNTILDIYLGLK